MMMYKNEHVQVCDNALFRKNDLFIECFTYCYDVGEYFLSVKEHFIIQFN